MKLYSQFILGKAVKQGKMKLKQNSLKSSCRKIQNLQKFLQFLENETSQSLFF
jgi:hypothetical protein